MGVLALVLELKAPGWGLAGTCGLLCLALFFGGRYMAGLAEWTEALVFLAGVTLLALEIFVIPGFGIVGISGMALMVLSFYLMMVDQPLPQVPWEWKVTEQSIQIISLSLFMAFVAGAAAVRILPHTPLWRKIGLVSSLSRDEGCVAGTEGLSQYLGQSGISASVLRPVGRGRFGSALVDVSTQGEFVEAGRPIKVIDIRGNVLVVEKV
jgi:membrane-bound serine protease (ClpP class)